jgi:hypothetical protein
MRKQVTSIDFALGTIVDEQNRRWKLNNSV